MPTDTFEIATGADDGECYIIENLPWPPTTGGTFNQNSGLTTANITKIGDHNGGTQGVAAATLLRWDTSSIPNDATITGANLILDVLDRLTLETPELSVIADYYDFGGDTPVLADWTLQATPSVITVQAISGYPDSPGDIETVAFTDLSGISKTGYTGLRMTLDEAATPTQSNYIEIALFEHATRQAPRLEVTYTIAGTGPRSLAGPQTLGTTAATLFTVPSGATYRIDTISVSNPTAGAVDFTLSVGTDAAATRLFDGYPIRADSEFTWHPFLPVSATEIVQAFAGTSNSLVISIEGTVF